MTAAARIEGFTMAKKAKLKRGTAIRAQKAARVSVARSPWDMGADGPANQQGLREEMRPFIDPQTGRKINPNGIRGVRRECWVDRYLRTGMLTVRQANVARALFTASEGRLREDPLSALFIDRGTDRPDPQGAAFDARRDFHRMWRMVPDYAKPIIERVVIEDLPVWSRMGRARDQHLQNLGDGLTELGDRLDRKRGG